MTSHYANPLAQFDKRAAAIEAGRGYPTLVSSSPRWTRCCGGPPTVFSMRRGANDTHTLRLASDVHPNQPNVRRYQVALHAALFDDPRFSVTNIGPFVLAIRVPERAR